MVTTFPRDFPGELRVTRMEFRLRPMLEIHPQRSGKQIASNIGPDLWRLSIESTPLVDEGLGVARAFFSSLTSVESFYAYDHLRQFPVSYKDGWPDFGLSPAFDGTCQLDDVTDSKLLDLSSLPEGFKLRPGDFLAFDYGSGPSRALHMVIEGGDASAAGELTAEVRPHVRTGWTAGTTVTLEKPAAEMKIVPESWSERIVSPNQGRVSFEAIQTL